MLSAKEQQKLTKYVRKVDVSRMSSVFDALGEPNRCLMFRALLREDNINVSQLAKVLGISESLASQHLKVLLQAGLVDKRKDGKNVYYSVNDNDSLVSALKRAVEI